MNTSAVPVSKALPEFQKGCQDKNNTVLRKACAVYLALLLRDRSVNTLLPYFDSISETVSGLLRDSDPQARKAARVCYASIKLYSPSHADSIASKADSKLKALLDDANFSEEFDLTKLSGATLQSPASKSASKTASRQQSRSTSPERERVVDAPTKSATSPAIQKPTATPSSSSPKFKTASPAPATTRRAAMRIGSPGKLEPMVASTDIAEPTPLSQPSSTPATTTNTAPISAPAAVDMDVVIRKLQRYSVSADSLKQLQASLAEQTLQQQQQTTTPALVKEPPLTDKLDFHKELVRLRRLIDQTQRCLDRDNGSD
eukprot:TRINITY_DN5537_c0_g1_i2.p1 TRINITY_DN5537_c0_g1~~TRINITY_DN5537_c0_g1_i2.p1  ORF type:complete len:316 (+),score=41.84 TRINITY_DN5537_c0_g1_i2:481-1428(+)